MTTNEFEFKGLKLNGFLMLALFFLVIALGIAMLCFVYEIGDIMLLGIAVIILPFIFILPGFTQIEPNEARVMVFFGTYKGTLTATGFHWVNPFMDAKKLSLRSRNLDVNPIKVNDKVGNPILIGSVLVWRLKDTYKAMFEIDAQNMTNDDSSKGKGGEITFASQVSQRMAAFARFVAIQSDAALREVAGSYAYDSTEGNDVPTTMTLRSGGEEINTLLEEKLNERLAMAGIEVVEARISHLAYAPEIAAVMLRRQQASAIISAREKIVEGAVSMVKLALDQLDDQNIVKLDNEKKAAMVSNLLVVLCSDEAAQPVVNTTQS